MKNKLTADEVRTRLEGVPNWNLTESGEISYVINLKNFSQALLLVNAIGLLAEAANHHPDITIKYNKVSLLLITHDANGLTQKDFDLALNINSLPLP